MTNEWIDFLASVMRLSTPLLLAAMGGLLSERSGIINIALEGKMLAGAFAAAVLAHYFHSPWLGAIGGGLAGVLVALLYSTSVISLKSNQIVSGTAINILVMGLTPFLCKVFFGVTSSTPTLQMSERLGSEYIGLAWVLAAAVAVFFYRTPYGLWVQFAGEHPKALDSVGVSVLRVRWLCVGLAGFLAGLGGASLSIYLSSSFTSSMTAGRGFMALAAVIFGKWRPIPTMAACVLFAVFDAMQIRLQGASQVPVQVIQALPYFATLVVLGGAGGFLGRSRPPKSLGIPI